MWDKSNKAEMWMTKTISRGLDPAIKLSLSPSSRSSFLPAITSVLRQKWSQLLKMVHKVHKSSQNPVTRNCFEIRDKEHVSPLQWLKRKLKLTIYWSSLIINSPTKTQEPQEIPHKKKKQVAFWKLRRNSRSNRSQTDIQPRYHSCLKIQNILNNPKSFALGIPAWPFSPWKRLDTSRTGVTGTNPPLHSPCGNTAGPTGYYRHSTKEGVCTA